MLIAHVEFRVQPEDRDAALSLLLQEAQKVRAMAGNQKFQAFLNPEQADTLEIVHEWDNEDGFATYLASENFAAIGAALGPKMTAPPVSKRFTATPLAQ
ncbi:putative quinol monooxygenase [Cognatishimia maritima]|uniref:Quinol monooxygenase YgiN n=1 Tax=Cognatishimia maritima TaxID=870908 RepID=A0A1M5L2V7_9RHOB|nr:putative quinol monooxygenase [Cognatishimia maritima]SHG59442.1 Quinol monooxygenase YgiN [Cognatishimia maritima]